MSSPAVVGVTVDSSWRLGSDAITRDEQTAVVANAMTTLREAFAGFRIQFVEDLSNERLIRIQDTPYSSRGRLGAAGVTYPATRTSTVYIDVLYNSELAATTCQSLSCEGKTRAELLDGLGRAVGATAAHELGHQAGFRFSRDSACDDCYDSHSAASVAHFFATKHWSDDALMIINRVLVHE